VGSAIFFLLHDALGRIGVDGRELVGADHAMLDAVCQGFFKERAPVVDL
jgi:hypothetical protein